MSLRRLALLGLLFFTLSASAYLSEMGSDAVRIVSERFGHAAGARMTVWQYDEKQVSKSKDTFQLLTRINKLANQLPYVEDLPNWGVPEYWATPLEFVGKGKGDCEDFAIAKYFSLRAAGIAAEHLRITYVRAAFEGRLVNHMVLTYYDKPDADPWVLDNLVPEILPASQRPDLVPVFSFNDDDQSRNGSHSSDGSMSRRWRELLQRIQSERRA